MPYYVHFQLSSFPKFAFASHVVIQESERSRLPRLSAMVAVK